MNNVIKTVLLIFFRPYLSWTLHPTNPTIYLNFTPPNQQAYRLFSLLPENWGYISSTIKSCRLQPMQWPNQLIQMAYSEIWVYIHTANCFIHHCTHQTLADLHTVYCPRDNLKSNLLCSDQLNTWSYGNNSTRLCSCQPLYNRGITK